MLLNPILLNLYIRYASKVQEYVKVRFNSLKKVKDKLLYPITDKNWIIKKTIHISFICSKYLLNLYISNENLFSKYLIEFCVFYGNIYFPEFKFQSVTTMI